MNLADALMGSAPLINPTCDRVFSTAEDDEPIKPARSASARSAAAYEKCRRILADDYATVLFTCDGVVKACRAQDIKICQDTLRDVIHDMLAAKEIRRVRAFGGRHYYLFASVRHENQPIAPGEREYKAKIISAVNITRHWPKAKTRFTRYALARHIRSDWFAKLAIDAMLQNGELQIIKSGRSTVYRLKEKQPEQAA